MTELYKTILNECENGWDNAIEFIENLPYISNETRDLCDSYWASYTVVNIEGDIDDGMCYQIRQTCIQELLQKAENNTL